MLLGCSTLYSIAVCASIVRAANTNDQVESGLNYGSFHNPSKYVRPRFRYWIPDASVDLDTVARDFTDVAKKGAGGFELLGYYLYGDYPSQIAEGGPTPVDWTIYGWGTEAWRRLTKVALQAAKDNDLLMDFALGPNQGAGVPAEPDNEGIMWDLLPYNVSVPIGGSFDDTIPGWGSGQLVSVSTGLVLSREDLNLSALPAWQGPYYYEGTSNTLSTASLQDVTDQVDSRGHISLQFPANTTGVEYQVFAYYQVHSDYREQASPLFVNTSVPQSPVETFVQNGSWIADHFSAAGAQLITDFWDSYLLSNGTRELIEEVGNYGWEDSMEFGAGVLLWWTPKLLSAFETSRGYSLNKYLPLVYINNTERNGPLASPDQYFLAGDDYDVGWQIVSDYRQTLTELNAIYLETLTNWTVETLQSQFSAQVVYNLPMDMLENIPLVNAPECESLGFSHIIDAYRQFSGPANLAGKRVISSELGAQPSEVYTQTMPELIWDTKRSVAGGINNFIYHGYPFSGEYPNTTWPGYTTFTYRFSNMHGPRQPAWEYYKDWMDWTARVQYVAQSGVPKIDLAFWLKRTEFYDVPSVYAPNDLAEAGYSYEYLGPENLFLPEAYVSDDKVLAPDRQAFKALVVRGNDTLTVPGVQKLVDFAHAGLPIIFSSGVPQNLTGYNASGTEYVRSALAGILDLDNVHQVPYDNLAASLQDIGITPRTEVNADRIWYTYWRDDEKTTGVQYVYIYNDAWDSPLGGGASSGNVTFEITGVPYEYNAWTGDIIPLAYEQVDGRTTVSLELAGNQSTIVGFHVNGSAHSHHSHGNHRSSDAYGPSVNLTLWNLTIESWSAPSDLSDQLNAAKSNTTFQLDSLQPWNEISDSLRNVSGRGIYQTTFTWPPTSSSRHSGHRQHHYSGAVLDFGAIVHTIRVWVNGHQLPPLDPTHAVADVSAFLVHGENEVLAVVSTPLGNAMREVYSQVKTSGTLWLGPVPVEQAYGLVSDVSIKPYGRG